MTGRARESRIACEGSTSGYVREMETINLGEADGLPPVDWAAVAEKLDARSAPAPDAANSRTTWLSTINEDGSPHVTAVGALWLDGEKRLRGRPQRPNVSIRKASCVLARSRNL